MKIYLTACPYTSLKIFHSHLLDRNNKMKIHSTYLEIIRSHIGYLFRKISFVSEKKNPLPRSRGDMITQSLTPFKG